MKEIGGGEKERKRERGRERKRERERKKVYVCASESGPTDSKNFDS